MAVGDNKNTQNNLDSHVAYGMTGLDMDNSLSQIKEGKLTYALNAIIEGYDGGGQINYQNEFGNKLVLTLPYKIVIGKRAIIEKNIYILFFYDVLSNHEIGIFDYKKNTYITTISGEFLNFDRDHPINKVEYEINGEATRIYWADNFNNDRYLDLNHIPPSLDANKLKVQPDFKIPYITIEEVTSGGNLIEGTYQFGIGYSDSIGTQYTGIYNITNPTPIFKGFVSQNFNLPTDKAISLNIYNLDKDAYQYFNLVVVKTINNISSFELVGTYPTDTTNNILYTGQSSISLTSEDIFQQFPVYERSQGVAQSDKILIWHGITEAKRVNYQEIASKISLQWVKYKIPYYLSYSNSNISEEYRGYMGDEVYAFEFQPILRSGKKCDGFHIPGRLPNSYDRDKIPNPLYSEEICTTDESSVERWKIENTSHTISDNSDYIEPGDDPILNSLQSQINTLKDEIATSNISIDSSNHSINITIGDINGWLYNRESGQHSVSHDIGSDNVAKVADLVTQNPINTDSISLLFSRTDQSSTANIGANIIKASYDINVLYNEINNLSEKIVSDTKKLNDLFIQYNNTLKQKGLCSPQPVAYGEFGYYESEEVYTDNKEIWGELAGKPIRHHKFPERKIHDSDGNIYPLGLRIDINQIRTLIKNSSLTQNEKDDIVGFKILRADRVGNKSVIAKGLINNVGISSREGETYFYPNYPFNDVRVDPFLSTFQTRDDSGPNSAASLDGFYSEESKKRFTFHSPDTSFYQPSLGDHIKLETIEYGQSIGHHIPVKNHPRYQIPSRAAYATAVAITMGIIGAGSKEGVGPGGLDVFGGSSTPWDEAIQVMLNVIDIINKAIPHKELAYQFNSVGNYNNSKDIPSSSQLLFNIDNNSRYINDGLANIDDIYQLNNFLRESSVFIKTDQTIPFTHELYPDIQDTSRWIATENACNSTTRKTNISTYYIALKKTLASQYGQIYSYQTIDTGYYFDLDSNGGTTVDVFGGDVYISKFAYKTKHSFFTQNLVGRQDNLGLDWRNYGNVAYPTYWMSNERDGKLSWGDAYQEAAGILTGAAAGGLGSMSIGGAIRGAVAGAILGGIGVLLDNNQNNFDCAGDKFFYQDGKFYLFAYGIPYFYVESEVNCDYRQAFNEAEGDFYPHVGGTTIPDEWLQETNVPIVNDNTYWYNKTFSKQNKESFTSHLPNDYDPDYQLTHNNRAIYSEKQSSETDYKINKWLLYRPLSFYDFPQTNGKLTSLDTIENRAVLARFENKSELYNAMLRIDTSNPQAVYLGNSTLFTSAPPIDYADTDLGYMGSHHKLFIKTEYGSISVDSERGTVFLINGQKARDISGNISKFLMNNLPFVIKDYFDISIDNSYNGIGLCGIYDSALSRVIITKLDYKPLMEDISYKNGVFAYNNEQIELSNSTYFENHCFTISYDFKTQSWISFHDYFPNYYLNNPEVFFSNKDNTLWVHDNSLNIFNNYYNTPSQYIIEYPFSYKVTDEILQCVKDYTKVYQYNNPEDNTDFIEVDDIYFDESILYSDKQCSGVLKLQPKPIGNMASYIKYPIYDIDSKTILYTKSNRFYQYNTFWSLVKDTKKPLFIKGPNLSIPKQINNDNMDYSKRSFKKVPLTTSNLRVRHTLNSTNDYKLLSQFILTQTQKSIK